MIHNLTQRTAEWRQIRLGKITGSKMKTIFSSNNLPLIYELIAEEISQTFEDTFISNAMQRGIDLEPLALEEYQKATGRKIESLGFITSDQYPFIGCSPDGVTGLPTPSPAHGHPCDRRRWPRDVQIDPATDAGGRADQ